MVKMPETEAGPSELV